ncbi:Transmembrane protein [Schistosoma japonicum]|nr:Transmembrane protein [Schistosoma japonicum]
MNLTSAIRFNKVCSCRWQTKFVMCVQCIFYLLSYIPNTNSYFCIIGGYLLPPYFRFWTLLTSSFYNYSLTFLLLDLLTVFLMDKLLSGPYKWLELLRFSICINLFSSISVTLFLLFFAFTYDKNILFSYHVCGLVALLGGVTVLGRQMMSDKLLIGFPLGKIRYKHIPFISTLFFAVLFSIGLCTGVPFSLFVTGIFIAWTYLRFFQKHSNGLLGDVDDSFTFAGFFPNHLGPPVSVISSAVFNVLVRLHICKTPSTKQISVPPSLVSFTVDINNTAVLSTHRYVSASNYVNPTGNQATTKSVPSTYAIPNFQTEHIQSTQASSIPLPPIPPPISVSNNNS